MKGLSKQESLEMYIRTDGKCYDKMSKHLAEKCYCDICYFCDKNNICMFYRSINIFGKGSDRNSRNKKIVTAIRHLKQIKIKAILK